jgi:hypothetical protein
MGQIKLYKVLVGKPERKEPTRKTAEWMGSDWGGGEVDSVGAGQGPVAGSCENGDEPSGSGATELVINKTEICFSVFTTQTFIVDVLRSNGLCDTGI